MRRNLLVRDELGRAVSFAGRPIAFCPHPGPQSDFFRKDCFEILYGGEAGGGKSACGVVGALRHIGKGYGPAYKALLLRREFPEMEASLIPETEKYYPALGGRYRSQKHYWIFPEGERVYLRSAQHKDDIKKLLGGEVQYVFFDELTTFLEFQYTYAISRMRSTMGIPIELRSGTNPGNSGHEWVFKRFAPWLDPECETYAPPGKILYFVRDAAGVERVVPKGTLDEDGNLALGRTFIRARVADNPSVGADYKRRLGELDPLTRAQLRDGNWLIKPGAGLFYKRPWFEVVDNSPEYCDRVRYWDKAATEGAGDWTVGTRLARPRQPCDAKWIGKWIVEDVIRGRWSPAHVEAEITKAAENDGREVTIGMPQDPGAAGVFELDHYVRELGGKGFAVRGYRETGDKITRQKPVSAQAEKQKILVLRGKWNETFFNMAEAFPDEGKDDIDSLAGAYELLTSGVEEYQPPKRRPGTSIANQMGGY